MQNDNNINLKQQQEENSNEETSSKTNIKNKKEDYIIKVVLWQAFICFLLGLFVFFTLNTDSKIAQDLRIDLENILSYSSSKEEVLQTFNLVKSYFTKNSVQDSVYDSDESIKLDGKGGKDLELYEAASNASFSPICLTQKALNPIEKPVYTSYFGYRDNPFTHEFSFHGGLDIAAKIGTNIRATLSGTVTKLGFDETAGNYIYLTHDDGLVSFYCHCDEILAQLDAKILQGETIAKVGETGSATGPHLHFEIRKNNVRYNPMSIL